MKKPLSQLIKAVVEYYSHTRGVGHTKLVERALENQQAILVVPNHEIGRYILQKEEKYKYVRMVTPDMLDEFAGTRLPIIFDNSILDEIFKVFTDTEDDMHCLLRESESLAKSNSRLRESNKSLKISNRKLSDSLKITTNALNDFSPFPIQIADYEGTVKNYDRFLFLTDSVVRVLDSSGISKTIDMKNVLEIKILPPKKKFAWNTWIWGAFCGGAAFMIIDVAVKVFSNM